MPIKGQSPKEVMHTEIGSFKRGELHSGSKRGPVVKSRKQAIAIGLSEARKSGGTMKHEHHEPTAPGHMGKEHEHHMEQGHAVKAPKYAKRDGAGSAGHDESGHMAHSEHKKPSHPETGHGGHGSTHHENDHSPGGFGYPGKIMELQAGDKDRVLVGGDYDQSMHEPAKLTHVAGPAGGIGTHAGMGKTPSGYGHKHSQKDGVHRLSGHPNAHRLGKRD